MSSLACSSRDRSKAARRRRRHWCTFTVVRGRQTWSMGEFVGHVIGSGGPRARGDSAPDGWCQNARRCVRSGTTFTLTGDPFRKCFYWPCVGRLTSPLNVGRSLRRTGSDLLLSGDRSRWRRANKINIAIHFSQTGNRELHDGRYKTRLKKKKSTVNSKLFVHCYCEQI